MAGPIELATAAEQLAQLRDRRIGSRELLDLLIARIGRLDEPVNAVVALDVERAREAARAADDAPPGSRGALHGLPMTIKDAYEVAGGIPTTCGMPELAKHYAQRDADAVALLRAAGAIPFGKTNLPYGAADHQSYNPVYGVTNNPWNKGRTPGGSSGGSAAGVAMGFTALELGSDIAGSIRCPAAFCGVYGHKSSFGIVPMRGHIPPPPGALSGGPLGVGGPLARSAEDLELALDILAAAAAFDRAAWSVRIPPSRHERLDDFRIAVWADPSVYSVDGRCVEALHAFAKELHGAGGHVTEGARPEIDPAASDDLYVALLFSSIMAGVPEEVIAMTVEAATDLKATPRSYPARIARAVRMTRGEYAALLEQQQVLCRAWQKFFEKYDVLLCPAMPTVAFPHDHSAGGPGHIAQYERTITVDGKPVPYLNNMQWPGFATIANLPATALPTGRLIDGLPFGIQAIGPYLEDRTPLHFAQLAARALGGFEPPPLSRPR